MALDVKKIVDSEVERALEVYAKFKKKEIDPLADVGNPEKIIGKPYGSWDPIDVQKLEQVYVYSPEKLSEFMAKKDIDRLRQIQDFNKELGV